MAFTSMLTMTNEEIIKTIMDNNKKDDDFHWPGDWHVGMNLKPTKRLKAADMRAMSSQEILDYLKG